MTKDEKEVAFSPKPYALYENGLLIGTYPSHAAAKKAKHFKEKESMEDMLDIEYEVKPYKSGF